MKAWKRPDGPSSLSSGVASGAAAIVGLALLAWAGLVGLLFEADREIRKEEDEDKWKGRSGPAHP